jgi:hypothetical protein
MRGRVVESCAGMLAVVLLLAGCSKSTEPNNQNPSVPQIHPTGFAIVPGNTVLVTARASDPDGDAVTYHWTFSQGTPATATGPGVEWAAPATPGTVTIMVKARDGRGGERSATTEVTVNANAAYPYGRPFDGTLNPAVDDLASGTLTGLASGTCHFTASVVAVWTGGVVTVFTGLPTAAFLGALAQEPVWVFPTTWIWSYTVPWVQSTATIELQATLTDPSHIDWAMLVSGTAQDLNRFGWVTGHSRADGTQGDWTLYDYRFPTQHIQALGIDYARLTDSDRRLSYHNLLTGSQTFGDSLGYSIRETLATVRLFSAAQQTTTRAVWDVSDGHGRFVGATGDSCCWGPRPTFSDINCP